MRGYDWGFGFGFGERHSARTRGYDDGIRGGYDRGMRSGGFRSGRSGPQGREQQGSGSSGRGGYGRGVYGEDYPVFGGVPGGRERGMYYGGRGGESGRGGAWGRPPERYGQGMSGAQGFQGGRSGQRSGRGYGGEYTDEPFLPDSAYRRHPEMEREPAHRADRWSGGGQGIAARHAPEDDEIEHSIRQNLYQDNWIDADGIDVEVSNGVATLRGEVRDFLEARYAWDDAWEADGVRGVLNQLTVRTDRPDPAAQAAPQPSESTPTEPVKS